MWQSSKEAAMTTTISGELTIWADPDLSHPLPVTHVSLHTVTADCEGKQTISNPTSLWTKRLKPKWPQQQIRSNFLAVSMPAHILLLGHRPHQLSPTITYIASQHKHTLSIQVAVPMCGILSHTKPVETVAQ